MQSSKPESFVDLELPSGSLWATGNIIKNGSTYAIGEETDYGCYFSWGNIEGHNEGEGYNFNETTYNNTPGASLTTHIASDDAAHDAALAYLGGRWRMPTMYDFKELYDYTDSEWVDNYNGTGVSGRKFMKKSDHSIYIFFPASGYYCDGTSLDYKGEYGLYSSSTRGYYDDYTEYHLYFGSGPSISPSDDSGARYYGRTIRAVMPSFNGEYVDLGLPSGLKWATGNIVKNGDIYSIGTLFDYGCYFSWGNVDGYNDGYRFNGSNYNSTPGKNVSTDIAPNDASHDAALACLGSPWRMPTKEDFQELYDNTDHQWVSVYRQSNTVKGWKFMKKSDHSVFVFFPMAGHSVDGGTYTADGRYSSSTYYSSSNAYNLYFNSSKDAYIQNNGSRYFGFSVRAVRD